MAQKPSKVDVVIANHPSFVVDADVESVERPVAFLKGDQDVSAKCIRERSGATEVDDAGHKYTR